MFQSRHPADSKYNSEAYKYRSKIFRPKTRSVIRKNEAAAAAAFFSNVDVVNVAPANPKDDQHIVGSALYKELLQYRLTKTIPWFLTLLGGFQDAMTVGVVCSYQHWKYRTKQEVQEQMLVDLYGQPFLGIDGPMTQRQITERVLEDKPCIDLLPVETLRIDRGASWIDPVNSSPYLIHLMPMYVGDLKEMGKANAKTGEAGWQRFRHAEREPMSMCRASSCEGRSDNSKEGASWQSTLRPSGRCRTWHIVFGRRS